MTISEDENWLQEDPTKLAGLLKGQTTPVLMLRVAGVYSHKDNNCLGF